MIQLKKFSLILVALIVALGAWLVHELLLHLTGNAIAAADFYHPLKSVYVFFYVCSAVILAVLIVVRQKNIDAVGQVFLLLTCIKMGVAYAYLYPVLQSGSETMPLEKTNFFIVFAIFLTLETVLTIRLLNKR